MNSFVGPFEKSLLGLLVILVAVYWVLDNCLPFVLYPELNDVRSDYSVPDNASPRQGRVVPAGERGVYMLDPAAFLNRDGFRKNRAVSSFDVRRINWFAKSTDGQMYPSNAFFVGFRPFRTRH
ncbi:MAG TPA: hypothetical protein PK470_08865, partial [Candidatus Omnitrophota bacterium]|nr:hypothetical protein [Candidatus Omnitrophota bacterium]